MAEGALPAATEELIAKSREHIDAQSCLDDLSPKQPEKPAVQMGSASTVAADQAPICPTAAVQSLSTFLLSNQTGLDHLFGNVESGGRQHMNLFFGRIEQAIQIKDTIRQRGSCEDVDYEGIVPLIETVRVSQEEVANEAVRVAQDSMGTAVEAIIGEDGTDNKAKKTMEGVKAKLAASAAKIVGVGLAKFQKDKVAPKPAKTGTQFF